MVILLKKIWHSYRDSDFRWRYIKNFLPWLEYSLKPQTLSPEATRVLNELNENGIALTHVDRLWPGLPVYAELKNEVDRLESLQADSINRARDEAEEKKEKKGFIYPLLGDGSKRDVHDIFFRFISQYPIPQIANAYMGLRASLKFYNVWHTFKIQGEPRRSQLWHQDPEDRYIFRVFLYMTDVDENAGPLVYAAGTHPKGKKVQPEYFLEPGHGAKRSTDEQMAAVVPQQNWVRALGPAGTLIFADTRGFHKGGLAKTKDRIMYNAMFVSQACKFSASY